MRSRERIEFLFTKGKYFCALPWAHLHISTLGYMSPCSLHPGGPPGKGYRNLGFGNLNEHSFHELWQGEAIRKFRLKKLADEMDDHCEICIEDEKTMNSSNRLLFNSILSPVIDWVADTDESGFAPQAAPITWDVRFSNLCNLKCRCCGADSSSSWHKDEQALRGSTDDDSAGITGLKDPGAFLQEMEPYFPHLKNLYFAGGEPLMYRENLAILEKLDSLGNHDVPLIYNTNFTSLNKNRGFLDLWKKFKDLTIWISLDGSSRRAEYLRKGSRWEDILSNLSIIKKECPQAEVVVKFTISAFNILHLPDFHKEMTEYLRADKINFNIVEFPEHYSAKILPKAMKEEATEKIEHHLSWVSRQEPFVGADGKGAFNDFAAGWRKCLHYMNSRDFSHLIPEFRQETRRVDHLRNENCLDVFPELEPLFREPNLF